MLLYLHVPFCRRKCNYCAFYSEPVTDEAREAYVSHVLRELSYWGRKLSKPEVETVHMGGGTPSLLPRADIMDLARALRKHFRLAKDLEFTIECNPESVTNQEFTRTLKAVGVTRVSLGVQSFNDEKLAMLGRPHTSSQALRAYNLLRHEGFASVNLDLIWGLPGQRLKLWLDELKFAIELKPEHLSCYGLTVEPDTPLESACLAQELTLPPEEEQSRMFVYGADFLESRGYLQYEISNFARMGYYSRHNLGYWEGRDYLGVGPAAVSTIAGERWENPADIRQWIQAVQNVQLGKEKEVLDLDTRIKEMIMLRLRTSRGLRLRAYRELSGRDFMEEHGRLVEALHKHNLMRLAKGYLRLTKNGMVVSDTILENFFRTHDESKPVD